MQSFMDHGPEVIPGLLPGIDLDQFVGPRQPIGSLSAQFTLHNLYHTSLQIRLEDSLPGRSLHRFVSLLQQFLAGLLLTFYTDCPDH
jgi:hypothetical protein